MAFQVRHDTAANWASANPVLASGELGFDTTNKKVKLGDGATAWNVLAYQGAGGAWGQITGTLANQTDLNSALGAKAPTSHQHPESDVTGLATDLAAKSPAGHVHQETDVVNLGLDLAGRALVVHQHSEADVTNLATDLSGKAPVSHSHNENDINNLGTDLGGKAPTVHSHVKASITDFPALGAAAACDVPTSGNATGGQLVKGSDTRLTDPRTPIAHLHDPTDVNGTAVITTDGRLSDARTPTAHTHPESAVTNLVTDLAGKAASSHVHAPADVTGTAVVTNDSRLSDSRPPTSHGNALHTVGVAGGASAPGDAAAEGSSASVARADHKHSREAFGTGSGTICQGNDGRLSDARTPLLAFSTLANGATAMALGTYDAVKVTPTVSASYTTTVPTAGKIVTIMILTSGTTAYTITFSTGFKTTGTLSTGTTTARIFCITFRSDGNSLYEIGRTAAMAA